MNFLGTLQKKVGFGRVKVVTILIPFSAKGQLCGLQVLCRIRPCPSQLSGFWAAMGSGRGGGGGAGGGGGCQSALEFEGTLQGLRRVLGGGGWI